jgi:hypothetical protein
MAVQKLTSSACELELHEDRLTIRRIDTQAQALGASVTEIAYRSIDRVVNSSATRFAPGYLQFVIPGVNSELTGRFRLAQDPHTFFYEHALSDEVVRAKAYVEQRMRQFPAAERAAAQLDMAGKRIAGTGAELVVFEDRVIVAPTGLMGLMRHGFKGATTIPYRSISALRHREATLLTPGSLQLVADELDEEFVFSSMQNETVRSVKAYIERRIQVLRVADTRAPTPPAGSNAGVVAQLEKLAELHEQGLLSDDEFEQARARVLGEVE